MRPVHPIASLARLARFSPLLLLLAACADDPPGTEDVDATDGRADAVADAGPADGGGDHAVDGSEDDADWQRPALLGAPTLVDQVDAFIGAGGLGFGYASLTPAAQRPLSWIRLGPDTTQNGSHPRVTHFSGYHMDDNDVRGFSHTHFVGTGAIDYGNIRVLPMATLPDREPWRRFVPHDKSAEEASPGVYRTRIDDGVTVELTTTDWAGLHRYTWDGDERWLQLDMASSVNDEGAQAVELAITDQGVEGHVVYRGGYVGRRNPYTLYVSATLDTAPDEARLWDATGLLDAGATAITSDGAGGVQWRLPDGPGAAVLRVGLSVVSLENARAHRAEIDDRSFDEVADESRDVWVDRLTGVRIGGATDDVTTMFATAAYNAWRMPSRWDEHDGRYLGLDAEIHTVDEGHYYTDLSLWDTFRTLHPWYELIAPDVNADCLRSLLAMCEANEGRMPRWPAAASATGGMIGASADVLFGGAAAKGLPGIDYAEALDVLWDANFGTTYDPPLTSGRSGAAEYVSLGYVPSDLHGNAASVTLEYAWNDFALAELAAAVGDTEREAVARERSRSWANLLDDDGFLMPRLADGSFDPDASTTINYQSGGPFTEGTAWHWRFYALHDLDGLADALGADVLEQELEAFFERSALGEGEGRVNTLLPDRYYWHGNEPAIHAAYVFHAVDRYDRAAYWLRQVQTRLYGTDPGGLPGNDDGGTMSTWYLFSALGFYPIAGSDTYLLGSPLVPYAELDLADGTTLTIEAPGASPDVWQVDAVTIDGRPVEGGRLRHADLSGATIRFEMRTTP